MPTTRIQLSLRGWVAQLLNTQTGRVTLCRLGSQAVASGAAAQRQRQLQAPRGRVQFGASRAAEQNSSIPPMDKERDAAGPLLWTVP